MGFSGDGDEPEQPVAPRGWGAAVRVAAAVNTVLPLGYRPPDRSLARRTAIVTPVVGAGLGLLAAGVLSGLTRLGAAPMLAGTVTVAVVVLATRGLHLDGLADTADALGSYQPPERALAIMKSPEVGPMGVAALILVLGVQATGFAQLAGAGRWTAAGLAVTVGMVAMTWACRRGIPPARPTGFGALWADSVPVPVAAGWFAAAAALGVLAVPGRPWQGPLAVLAAWAATELLGRHARRRLGGSTGDVLGAAGEIAMGLSVLVLALGAW
ncbi:adenosylcobinamide-GDP ribazoletransferase [Amycolatopsis sp. MtRt-6]|uniref:adenosylcobinamide-GDP ribazoletransferase n=1 Tax=Amycolatopsis sp. MtRt-6 TaxID=2792782 RepID=UPI001F5C311C|nr:adenosylcobinamide-GDP ribazoletransferase [Amycolatopsis sp. MtRt-6]